MARASVPPSEGNRHLSGVVVCPARAQHAVVTAIYGDHARPYIQWCSLCGTVDCEQRCLGTLPPVEAPQAMGARTYQTVRVEVQRVYERMASQQPPRFPTWQHWAQGLLAGVGTARAAWHAAETVREQALLLNDGDPDRELALAAESVAWSCVQAHSGRDAETAECAAQARDFLNHTR